MTISKSSSLVESSTTMDNATVSTRKPSSVMKTTARSSAGKKKALLNGESRNGYGERVTEEEDGDAEAWSALSSSFKQVQTVLDQNRDLIHQVNANHQSKIPDNLRQNVSLIREINGNISKVMSIYSDLSVNFSSIVHEQRRSGSRGGSGGGGGGHGESSTES